MYTLRQRVYEVCESIRTLSQCYIGRWRGILCVCSTIQLLFKMAELRIQIVGIVDTYTTINLLLAGFKHYAPRESQWSRTFPPRLFFGLHSRSAPEGVAFPYWYRPHRSKGHLPLVFLHGIGVILPGYPRFICLLIF